METLQDDDLLMKAFCPTDFRGHRLENATSGSNVLATDLPTSVIPRLFPTRLHSPSTPLPTKSMTKQALFSEEETRYTDESRSSSNGTVEIHLPPTPDYPLSETSSDSGASDYETPSKPRILAQVQDLLNIASQAQRTNDAEATVRGRDHMKENRAKVPWQSPSQEDFTPRTKSQNITCRPRHPVSQGTPSYNDHTIGRMEGRKLVEERQDTKLIATMRNDSPALTLSEFTSDRQSTPEADCEQEGSEPCTDADRGIASSLTVSLIGKQDSNATAQDLKSPNISPRIWHRRDISSGKYFTVPATAPTREAVSRIPTFDLTVELYTAAAFAAARGIQVHYHARLTVVNHERDSCQEYVTLPIIVKNALESDQICKLHVGETSVLFKEDVGGPLLTSEGGGCTITIVRQVEDLGLPLDLYFSINYPPDERDIRVMIPTFQPKLGSAVSERVFVMEPSLPLVLKVLGRSQLSTWIPTDHPGHGTYFERASIPRLYPEELRDDICVKFTELGAVQFKESPLSEHLSSFVWNFDVTLRRICDAQLQCHMRLNLVVGEGSTLISIDRCGWIPQIFFIDGYPATEGESEWRSHGDCYILLKQPLMVSGQIVQIEMYWQEAPAPDTPNDNIPHDFILPRVTDHKVRTGKLSSDLDMASFTLINPMAVPICFTLKASQSAALNVLHQGHLISFRLPNSTTTYSKPKLLRLPKPSTGYVKSRAKRRPPPPKKGNGVRFVDQGGAPSRLSAPQRNKPASNNPVNTYGGSGGSGGGSCAGDPGDNAWGPGTTPARQRQNTEKIRVRQARWTLKMILVLLVSLAAIWTLLCLMGDLDADPAVAPVDSAPAAGSAAVPAPAAIVGMPHLSGTAWLVGKWETPRRGGHVVVVPPPTYEMVGDAGGGSSTEVRGGGFARGEEGGPEGAERGGSVGDEEEEGESVRDWIDRVLGWRG